MDREEQQDAHSPQVVDVVQPDRNAFLYALCEGKIL
jgi:hypothetical protein